MPKTGSKEIGRVRQERTFCRICTAHCGLIVSIDDEGRPVAAHGDRDDPHSLGFICSKGAAAPQAHTHESRLLHPMKRMPDGSFREISLETALDEIAQKLVAIVERDGPDALAAYRGTGGFFTTAGLGILNGFLDAFGSHKLYTTLTIDQSCKVVSAFRLGIWPAGTQSFGTSDVAMMFGGNPFVSMAQFDSRNPAKRMAQAKARGLKVIIIDPRYTETARHADIFLQPLPGHDAAIAAAMIRIILDEGLHDAPFCADNVADLDALRAAVTPFDAISVARRAGIAADDLVAATRLFAEPGKRGTAISGTGIGMTRHSNLAQHLIDTLNILCGRFVRAGERIDNPGLVMNPGPKPAQVFNLPRPWDSGPRSRIGDYGLVGGEMVTGKLADDILQPGAGQVRILFNHGGNPAAAVPDQRKMARALGSLDLLVSIDPVMSATARLSHYILPPKLQFERPDLPIYLFEAALFPQPYTRYTPALVPPPEHAELCDEWRVFYEIARRAGRALSFMGTPLDMDHPPKEDDLIALTLGPAPVTLEEVQQHPQGYFHPEETLAVPADPATAGRFTLFPADVADEMTAMTAGFTTDPDPRYPFLLSSRRSRHRMNSIGNTLPDLQRLFRRNHGYMHPDDMADLRLASGDPIEIMSEHGAIIVDAEADPSVRRGVVSISHGFGGLPDDGDDWRDKGASPNLLISTDCDLQTINAMPRMTAIPVAIRLAHGEARDSDCPTESNEMTGRRRGRLDQPAVRQD